MRKIKMIVIHCSDTPDSLAIGAEDIRRWHIDGNGWDDIGYHWVIRRNGLVEHGRKEARVGAHVKGYNSHSIGICWVGRDEITEIQLRRLKIEVVSIMLEYDLSINDVYGHYELDKNKTCPNIDMVEFRNGLKEKFSGLS